MIGPHGDPFVTATYDYTKYPTVPMNPAHPIYTSELNDANANSSDDEERISSSSDESRNESGDGSQQPAARNQGGETAAWNHYNVSGDAPPTYNQIYSPSTRAWYTTGPAASTETFANSSATTTTNYNQVPTINQVNPQVQI
jgi:hypothetical protein